MSWNVKERIAEALDEGRRSEDVSEIRSQYDKMSDSIMASLTMFEDLVAEREKNRMRIG